MNGSQRINDRRGSAYSRRARRRWLLARYAVAGGTVCHRCGQWLPADGNWHVDRWPVPGWAGGRYVRENIRPACASCNVRHVDPPKLQKIADLCTIRAWPRRNATATSTKPARVARPLS